MDFEKEIEEGIVEAIKNNSYIEAEDGDGVLFPTVENVRTFKEASILTTDKGVVIDLNDGSTVYLTIQAYK